MTGRYKTRVRSGQYDFSNDRQKKSPATSHLCVPGPVPPPTSVSRMRSSQPQLKVSKRVVRSSVWSRRIAISHIVSVHRSNRVVAVRISVRTDVARRRSTTEDSSKADLAFAGARCSRSGRVGALRLFRSMAGRASCEPSRTGRGCFVQPARGRRHVERRPFAAQATHE